MNKAMRDLAKFNALTLTATQLKHQCSAKDTFYDLDCIDDELKESIDREVDKIVKSLYERSEKLNSKYSGKLVDITGISQQL